MDYAVIDNYPSNMRLVGNLIQSSLFEVLQAMIS